jgi:hypothetical protein
MNATATETFPLHRPAGLGEVHAVGGEHAPVTGDTVLVGPQSTVVLVSDHD